MANRIMLNQTSYHGAGAIEEIVNEAKAHAFQKAFVCSDPDLIKFGVTGKVTGLLDKEGLAYEVYSDIKANPTIDNVKNGVAAFKASGADYIIAIGGGSSMDTSKAIGIIIANPEFEDVRSLEGVAPTKKPCVPIIAVPTTAGTAAEVTINYVITDVERKRKFVCVDPHDMPIIAVVDPEMMSSMPKGLTASTGMDALTHAIEAQHQQHHKDRMKISTKGRYAVRVMLDLALNNNGECIKVKEIAARQGISEKYLEQIIAVLNKAGYVKSVRGAQGGYRIAKDPADFTVGMILRLTEGSLAPVACLEEGADICERCDTCETLEVWQELYDAVNKVVDGVTIADLVERRNKRLENLDYSI